MDVPRAGSPGSARLAVALAITVALPVALPTAASAQDDAAVCAEGRERGGEGRCCWPGQAFSIERGRCEGAPRCPEGTVEHGDACVAPLDVGIDVSTIPPATLEMPTDLMRPEGYASIEEMPVPPPVRVTTRTFVPDGYGRDDGGAEPVDVATWPTLEGLALERDPRRAREVAGEDETLIGLSLAIFDVGWIFGWLVPLLDDATGSCAVGGWGGPRTSCQSWPLAFVPVVGGLFAGLTNFGGGMRTTTAFGVIHGSISLVLQLTGIIASAISFSNTTTEYELEVPLGEDGGAEDGPSGDGAARARLGVTFDAPGSDAGLSLVLRF